MRLTGDQKNFEIFFQFFPHAGTVEVNTRHFEVLLLFLSLRYGADLGRSRLVLKLLCMFSIIKECFHYFIYCLDDYGQLQYSIGVHARPSQLSD